MDSGMHSVRSTEEQTARMNGAVMWKTEATHVLSVGSVQRGCLVHEALHSRSNTHLSITPDWRRLWVLPKQENFHVVVLHNTLSGKELEEASQFIRRQWPQARILVIRFGQEFLDDALYDERVTPAASTETLQAAIDRLVEDRR